MVSLNRQFTFITKFVQFAVRMSGLVIRHPTCSLGQVTFSDAQIAQLPPLPLCILLYVRAYKACHQASYMFPTLAIKVKLLFLKHKLHNCHLYNMNSTANLLQPA